jgi:SAM-dependent methyltransferase
LSETALLAQPAADFHPDSHRRILLAGVLVMSFASLLLELALTRLFSVILFYHFAFLAISIALLGLGAGGVFAYLARNWLARWDLRTLGARLAAVNSVLLLLALEVDLHTSVSLALDVTPKVLLRLGLMYIASALPFFCTGLLFSTIFARETRGITQLYAADLTGGALACLGIVPLLNFVGGPNCVFVAAIASAAASTIWAPTRPSRRLALLLLAAFTLLTAANYSGWIADIVYAKGMRRDQSWVLFARWNALSRVEVDDQNGAKVIVIDADASTYIMNTDPHNWRPDYQHNLMSAAPAVVNVLRPRGDYAIIGPGGGVDVLRALANGSPSVTGIEINPIIVDDIMRGRWADYSYHLYDRPDVHIHVGDGRSWVRNARDKFDVVQMTLVDTWASTAAGAFALSENNLYTIEAFREYFDHLKPDGIIAITRWEFRQPREALRVVSQELEVLKRAGIADPASHFIVISERPLNEDGVPVAVLFKKSPFTTAEEAAIRTHIAQYPDLHILYMPTNHTVGPGALAGAAIEQPESSIRQAPSPAGPESGAAFRDLISSTDPRSFAATYSYDVTPVYDNAPFFFFTFKTKHLLKAFHAGSSAIDWKVNAGLLVLACVLAFSVVAVIAFLLLPLMLYRITTRTVGPGAPAGAPSSATGNPMAAAALGRRKQSPITPLLYFIAIGLGYILAEIAFIQRFVLFLGHPTYALTVVIFLMLLSSGAGSLLSRRLLSDPMRVRLPLLIVIVLLLSYVWALPPLLRSLVGLPFAIKLIISASALVPLGLAMGMPFPSGLRELAASTASDGNTIEWAWALNAASSVLGSVLAMVIAIQFGLNLTLACGAAAYLLALLLAPRLRTLPHQP